VHGGSVALLFENIIHMILFYLTKNIYNTKDINIIYKRQVLLNVDYTLKIKIEKIKYKTIFIHCNLFKSKNNNEESAEANIIVEKEIINKI
jgi:acyl-CoA thioesterase FadM